MPLLLSVRMQSDVVLAVPPSWQLQCERRYEVSLTCFYKLLCFLPSCISASATTSGCIDGCFNSRVGPGLVLLQANGVGPNTSGLKCITAGHKHDTQALM